MKKMLIAMLMVLVFSQMTLGNFMFHGEADYYTTDSLDREVLREAKFAYEDDTVFILLQSGDEFLVPIETLDEALETYHDWRKTALENEVTTDKEINYNSKPMFFFTTNLHAGLSKVRYGMVSETMEDHRFYIYIDEVVSADNQYISSRPNDRMVFTYDQIEELEYRISEEAFEEVEQKQSEQEKVDELFQ